MEDETRTTPDTPPYPSQPRGGGARGWSTGTKVAALVLGVVTLVGAAVGLAFAGLWAVNPMGDEWVCSDGEAPVDALNNKATMAGCVPVDTALPEHVRWDPLGNRPMPYNCDKDGWRLVERPVRGGGVEEECLHEHLGLPKGWTLAEEG